MKPSLVKKLKPNDTVFWNDPDSGTCSRLYVIQSIEYIGGIVKISDKDGGCLECYARELR